MNLLTVAITIALTSTLTLLPTPTKDIDQQNVTHNNETQQYCLETAGAKAWYSYIETNKNSNRYNKYGYKQVSDNKTVIAPQYVITYNSTCFNPLTEKAYIAVGASNSWAYIDKDGKVIVQAYNVEAAPDLFFQGLSRYVDNKKIGFINEDLEIIIPAQFDGAYTFQNENAKVCNGCQRAPGIDHAPLEGGTWGIVDKEGNVTWE